MACDILVHSRTKWWYWKLTNISSKRCNINSRSWTVNFLYKERQQTLLDEVSIQKAFDQDLFLPVRIKCLKTFHLRLKRKVTVNQFFVWSYLFANRFILTDLSSWIFFHRFATSISEEMQIFRSYTCHII